MAVIVAQMLGQLISTGQRGSQTFVLMNMIGNRAAIQHRSDEGDKADEDFDVDGCSRSTSFAVFPLHWLCYYWSGSS